MDSSTTSIRIRYSETDRMGLAYHVNYLEYFELARSDWFRQFWRPYREIEDEGYCLVVTEAHIHYLRPASYDDLLRIEVRPEEWGQTRITFSYTVRQENETEPICTGRTVHCFIDRNGKAIHMPAELQRRLAE